MIIQMIRAGHFFERKQSHSNGFMSKQFNFKSITNCHRHLLYLLHSLLKFEKSTIYENFIQPLPLIFFPKGAELLKYY